MTINYYDAVFHLDKDLISKKELRRELRVQSNKGHKGSLLTEDPWEETPEYWLVPRPWAFSKGFEGEDKTPLPKRKWPKVKIKYLHNQKECLDKVLDALKNSGFGCCRLVAETGYGKSVFALEVARQLKTNALVIVPTNEVFNQFKENASEIFNVKCGEIKGKKQQTDELVTLVTYQTLARRINDDLDYLDKFGLCVVDEAHLAGCASIQKILTKVNSRYRLSVSADFYRADGLAKVYELCLGEVAAKGVKNKDQSLEKRICIVDLPQYVDPKRCLDYLGDFSHVKYKTLLATNTSYNQKIVEICNKIVESGNRRILLGIKRLEQAEILKELFGDKAGLFTGKSKEDELRESATKDIILYSKSDLGLDMSKFLGKELEQSLSPLNVVIPLAPTANSKQLTGRGGRENRGPVALIILFRMQDFFSKSQVNKDVKKNYTTLQVVKDLDKFLREG